MANSKLSSQKVSLKEKSTSKVLENCKSSLSFHVDVLESAYKQLESSYLPKKKKSTPDIHGIRIASRKLSTALSESEGLLAPELFSDYSKRVKSIGRLLSRPRELDVMIELLSQYKLQLKGRWFDAAEHSLIQLQLSKDKTSSQIEEALEVLNAASFKKSFKALINSASNSDTCLLDFPPSRLNSLLTKLKKDFNNYCKSKDEELLHEIRITLKKLQFTCEVYSPLYGEKMDSVITNTTQYQEMLGLWNDWRLLRDELDSISFDAPYRTAQGFPLLVEQLDVQSKRRLYVFKEQEKDFKDFLLATKDFVAQPIAPCCQWKDK